MLFFIHPIQKTLVTHIEHGAAIPNSQPGFVENGIYLTNIIPFPLGAGLLNWLLTHPERQHYIVSSELVLEPGILEFKKYL